MSATSIFTYSDGTVFTTTRSIFYSTNTRGLGGTLPLIFDSSLVSVRFGANVVTLNKGCFEKCTALTNIKFDNAGPGSLLTNINTIQNFSNTSVLTVDYYYASNYDSLAQSQKNLQNTTEANGGFKSGTLFVYHSACFNKGTKILCLNEQLQEEWLPIETLKENQLVKTYLHGYKKIKMIGEGRGVNTSGRNIKNMYKYNYKSNDFDEPLMITGAHAILVDDIKECKEENDKILLKWHDKITMVDDKYLLLAVVSSDFEVMEEGYEFTYYHFCLESENEKDRYGVWANGVLTESISLYDFKTCF